MARPSARPASAFEATPMTWPSSWVLFACGGLGKFVAGKVGSVLALIYLGAFFALFHHFNKYLQGVVVTKYAVGSRCGLGLQKLFLNAAQSLKTHAVFCKHGRFDVGADFVKEIHFVIN